MDIQEITSNNTIKFKNLNGGALFTFFNEYFMKLGSHIPNYGNSVNLATGEIACFMDGDYVYQPKSRLMVWN